MQNLNYAPAEAPRTSPFDLLAKSIGTLEGAESRMRELADRICGAVPRSVEGQADGKLINSTGLIDGLERHASVVDDLSRLVLDEISRIERRL